jgi:hypothetical protein
MCVSVFYIRAFQLVSLSLSLSIYFYTLSLYIYVFVLSRPSQMREKFSLHSPLLARSIIWLFLYASNSGLLIFQMKSSGGVSLEQRN